jgi:hypothetical protein
MPPIPRLSELLHPAHRALAGPVLQHGVRRPVLHRLHAVLLRLLPRQPPLALRGQRPGGTRHMDCPQAGLGVSGLDIGMLHMHRVVKAPSEGQLRCRES